MLTDDTPNLHHQPTRANIIDAMRWLVRDAQPHDSLFLHCTLQGYLRVAIVCSLSCAQIQDMADRRKISTAMRLMA